MTGPVVEEGVVVLGVGVKSNLIQYLIPIYAGFFRGQTNKQTDNGHCNL